MKFNTIASKSFFSSSTWNALAFITESNKIHSSQYNLFPLREITSERKELINPQQHSNHTFNYIGLENVESNTRLLVNFIPKRGILIKSNSKIFKQCDILYGRLRPNLNKALLIDHKLIEGICSTEFFVLKPINNVILGEYLAEILTSRWVLSEVTKFTRGAALPRIQLRDFLEIKVPIPPIAVQNQICSFITKERNKWLEYRRYSISAPSIIKDSVDEFLIGKATLTAKTAPIDKRVWNNPLP